MPFRLTRKKVIVAVVLAVPLLIGGGYLSNLLTITACEAELQAFSKEQWKADGMGQKGYIGAATLRLLANPHIHRALIRIERGCAHRAGEVQPQR